MRLIIVTILAVVLAAVMAVSCSHEKEMLRQKLAVQTDSIGAIRTELRATADSAKMYAEQIAEYETKLNDLTAKQEQADKRSSGLDFRMNVLKQSMDSAASASASTLAQKDLQLRQAASELTDSTAVIGNLHQQVSVTRKSLDSVTQFVQVVQPWYAKWRHDATERNFLEVLFGSDKAESPGVPEPTFGAVEASPDTSHVPEQATPIAQGGNVNPTINNGSGH